MIRNHLLLLVVFLWTNVFTQTIDVELQLRLLEDFPKNCVFGDAIINEDTLIMVIREEGAFSYLLRKEMESGRVDSVRIEHENDRLSAKNIFLVNNEIIISGSVLRTGAPPNEIFLSTYNRDLTFKSIKKYQLSRGYWRICFFRDKKGNYILIGMTSNTGSDFELIKLNQNGEEVGFFFSNANSWELGGVGFAADSTIAIPIGNNLNFLDESLNKIKEIETRRSNNIACIPLKNVVQSDNGDIFFGYSCRTFLQTQRQFVNYDEIVVLKDGIPEPLVFIEPDFGEFSDSELYQNSTMMLQEERIIFGNNYLTVPETDHLTGFSVHSVDLNGTVNWSRYYGMKNAFLIAKQFLSLPNDHILVIFERRILLDEEPWRTATDIVYIELDENGELLDTISNISTLNLMDKERCVFPNPTNGTFSLKLPSVDLNGDLLLYNLAGIEVFKTSINHNEPMDIGHLPNGIYFYKAFSLGKNLSSGKIILDRK